MVEMVTFESVRMMFLIARRRFSERLRRLYSGSASLETATLVDVADRHAFERDFGAVAQVIGILEEGRDGVFAAQKSRIAR